MVLHRIPTHDIEKTMRQGKKLHASHVFFSIKKNNTQPPCNRFAFIVSTKVDKRAVVRNTVRRKMKEILRATVFVREGYDIVCVARATAVYCSYTELTHSIRGLIQKIR